MFTLFIAVPLYAAFLSSTLHVLHTFLVPLVVIIVHTLFWLTLVISFIIGD